MTKVQLYAVIIRWEDKGLDMLGEGKT